MREANPAVYEATALIRTAAPQIEKTLSKDGPGFPEFRRALIATFSAQVSVGGGGYA